MNYIRINDRNIFYHDGGGNAPALVLVHGLTCDMNDWSAQVDVDYPHKILDSDGFERPACVIAGVIN